MNLSMLGLMRKANAVVFGEDKCQEALEKGKARLLIIPSDAKDKTKKNAEIISIGHSAPLITLPCTNKELASALGISSCAMLAVLDLGFADAFVKSLGDEFEETKSILKQKKEKISKRKNIKKG